MHQLEKSVLGIGVKSAVRDIMGHAGVVIVYLGIVATFALFAFVFCVFWLLVW
jgi:hypothetical protein